MVRFILLLFFPLVTFANEAGPILQMDALLEGPNEWYPGQEGSFVYKISYRGSVQLLEERFPLLEMEGFEKLGDKQFKQYREGGLSVQEISQAVRATKSGTFVSAPSEIVGIQKVIINGKERLLPPEKRITIPSLSITVLPFPAVGQPASFNGSVGRFDFDLEPPSNREVRVGDPVNLTITVHNVKPLDPLFAPDVANQPGISGLFRVEESSPMPEGETSYLYSIKLTPLNSLAKTIPSISWSSFDPKGEEYLTWQSEPVEIDLLEPTLLPPPIERKLFSPLLSHQPKEPQEFKIPTDFGPSILERLFKASSDFGPILLLALPLITLIAIPLTKNISLAIEERKKSPLYRKKIELFETKDQKLAFRAWEQLLTDQLIDKGYLQPNGEWIEDKGSLFDQLKPFFREARVARFSEKKPKISKNVAKEGLKLYQMAQKLPPRTVR